MQDQLAIHATDVHVVLGGTHILHGIDLDVPRGQVVALMGANGSGKSTLVRAILGIIPRTEGNVELLGYSLGKHVPWGNIGYVPQRSTAISGVPTTALEVVTSGLIYGRKLRPGKGARARASAALSQVGLHAAENRNIAELSGGQQQRVLIARALVRKPKLLVLDEPTAGVDLDTQEAFVETLTNLQNSGVTVAIVLHEIGPYLSLIDRSVVIDAGRIIHDGPCVDATGYHAAPDHQHEHPHADPELPPHAPRLEIHP